MSGKRNKKRQQPEEESFEEKLEAHEQARLEEILQQFPRADDPPKIEPSENSEHPEKEHASVLSYMDNPSIGAEMLITYLSPVQLRHFLWNNPDFDINKTYNRRPHHSLLTSACATQNVAQLRVLFEEGRNRKVPLKIEPEEDPRHHPIVLSLSGHLNQFRIDACCFLLKQPEFDNPKDRMLALMHYPLTQLQSTFVEAILCSGSYKEEEIIDNWEKLVSYARRHVSYAEDFKDVHNWLYILEKFVKDRAFFFRMHSVHYSVVTN